MPVKIRESKSECIVYRIKCPNVMVSYILYCASAQFMMILLRVDNEVEKPAEHMFPIFCILFPTVVLDGHFSTSTNMINHD